MSNRLDDAFLALSRSGSMSSRALLGKLHDLAVEAARRGSGTIVEIGAYRGASTVALALGIVDAGSGHVYSIDPHQHFRGILGGIFSPDDHAVYEDALRSHGVVDVVTHYCSSSKDVSMSWDRPIDLLWIDGDHSYDGVAADLLVWLPFLSVGGVVVLDDHAPGSEVEAAVRDHLPFSHFLTIDRVGNALILRRLESARTMILCGGMQSGGSTLVSRCFLQREDMDGVYDMFNALVQQDFSRVRSPVVWVKMTIGAFRLSELESLYSAQGWQVRALLVQRDPEESLSSLVSKPYGIDGCTAEDPPLLLRLMRYKADLALFRERGGFVLSYEGLIRDPEAELRRCCSELSIPWDPAMLTWPKDEASFAYPSLGNETLRKTLVGGGGLIGAIDRYRSDRQPADEDARERIRELVASSEGTGHSLMLSPARFRGTRRDMQQRELSRLSNEVRRLERIERHPLLGRLVRYWGFLLNRSLLKRI